jgi:hypothetical protein
MLELSISKNRFNGTPLPPAPCPERVQAQSLPGVTQEEIAESLGNNIADNVTVDVSQADITTCMTIGDIAHERCPEDAVW